jgi:hypothetical protein
MSPVSRHFAPPSTSAPATEMPTSSAARASSTVIAGSTARSRVPRRMFASSRVSPPCSGIFTPTSTTISEAPT